MPYKYWPCAILKSKLKQAYICTEEGEHGGIVARVWGVCDVIKFPEELLADVTRTGAPPVGNLVSEVRIIRGDVLLQRFSCI